MKRISFFILLATLFAGSALADFIPVVTGLADTVGKAQGRARNRAGMWTISDTLIGTTKDTCTFAIPEGADVLTFEITPTALSTTDTDSLLAYYRCPIATDSIASQVNTILTGTGSVEVVTFINESGGSVSNLDWTSARTYTLEVDPLGCQYQQIILDGQCTSDTILYVLRCKVRNNQ